MQFNSFVFLLFFSITFLLYCTCNHRWQNRILLVASYFFYAAWDYRFLSLIVFSTGVDYLAGLKIASCNTEKKRKVWLTLSLVSNLGLLGFFKYFNFFIDNLDALVTNFGFGTLSFPIRIILPVGISFYTFQTMSYTIDIYFKKLTPTPSLINFALYVSFFPQLVAGPIERARNFLPQICSERKFSGALFKSSVFLILYGLFEKVVVADNLAVIVDGIYTNNEVSGFKVFVGTYAFAFQIFADFDGYSNMAKGLAGLMGFHLTENFRAPYFSQSPSEFWRRWHISLSTWLRDYLYIPLGGNKFGRYITIRNLWITMLLGGLWHGAGWMFLGWGAYHAFLLMVYLPLRDKDHHSSGPLRRVLFFHLICLGWMIFRAEDVQQFSHLFQTVIFNFDLSFDGEQLLLLKKVFLYASVPLIYQFLQYRSDAFFPLFTWPTYSRAFSYVVIFYLIVVFGFNNAQSFIYFQF